MKHLILLLHAKIAKSNLVQYSLISPNAFFRKNPPAKIRKGGGAAPLKTAKEPGEKHRLEPYFNFWGRKIFNHYEETTFTTFYNYLLRLFECCHRVCFCDGLCKLHCHCKSS